MALVMPDDPLPASFQLSVVNMLDKITQSINEVSMLALRNGIEVLENSSASEPPGVSTKTETIDNNLLKKIFEKISTLDARIKVFEANRPDETLPSSLDPSIAASTVPCDFAASPVPSLPIATTTTLPGALVPESTEAAALLTNHVDIDMPKPAGPSEPDRLSAVPSFDQADQVHHLLVKIPEFHRNAVILDSSGSNFNKWHDDLEDAIELMLGKTLVFVTDAELDPVENIIVRSMIKNTIDSGEWSLQREIMLAKDIVASLSSKFYPNNRAAHLAIWREILSLRFDPNRGDLQHHCTRLAKLFDNLRRSGFVFGDTTVSGAILQLSLPLAEGPFRHLNRAIEAEAKNERPIAFDDIVNKAMAELRNFHLDARDAPASHVAAAVPRRASSSPAPKSVTQAASDVSTPSNPEFGSASVDLAESKDTRCSWCLKKGHWSFECRRLLAGHPMVPRPPDHVAPGKQERCLSPEAPSKTSASSEHHQSFAHPRPPKINAADFKAQTEDHSSQTTTPLLGDGNANALDSKATDRSNKPSDHLAQAPPVATTNINLPPPDIHPQTAGATVLNRKFPYSFEPYPTVVIRGPKGVRLFENQSACEIVAKLNAALLEGEAICDRMQVKVLLIAPAKSGGVELFMQPRQGACWLIDNKHKWTKLIESDLTSSPNRYPVVFHCWPTKSSRSCDANAALFANNAETEILELCATNKIKREIIHEVKWLGFPLEKGKMHGSLIVTLLDKELATNILERGAGLVFRGTFLRGVPFKVNHQNGTTASKLAVSVEFGVSASNTPATAKCV